MSHIHDKRLTMPDLHQLKTLVLTADLGSLAAVAKKLNLSPAAISKQLSRLEEELGLQLLIRSTRKIEFTDAGLNYCEQCRRILEEVDAADALISQSKAIPSGTLKVFSGRNFGNKYIVPYVKEFLLKYPNIELNLVLAERIPDLNLESIDISIGMSISSTVDTIQKRIATTHYVFAAAPHYLKQMGIPKKPQDLTKHRYITHSVRNPDNILTFHKKDIVSLTPYIRVNDVEAMLKFANDGLGIIMVHRYAIEEDLKAGKLIEVLKEYSHTDTPIYVAYPKRRFIPSKTRLFIDFFTRKVKSAAEGS